MEWQTRCCYIAKLMTRTEWDLWCYSDGVQAVWLQKQRTGKVFINCSACRSLYHSLEVRKCFYWDKALDFSSVIFHHSFLYFEPVLLEFGLWELQVHARSQASVFHIDLFAAFLSYVSARVFPMYWMVIASLLPPKTSRAHHEDCRTSRQTSMLVASTCQVYLWQRYKLQ